MFYEFGPSGMKLIDERNIDPERITAGYITLSRLKDCYRKFGFSKATLDQCQEERRYFRSSIAVYEDYCFSTITVTDAKHPQDDEDCVAVYVKKNFFLVVDVYDRDMSTSTNFKSALNRYPASTVSLERLVYAFLDSIIARDNRVLEDLEFNIHKLEESIFEGEVEEDFNRALLGYKTDLLYLRNYYVQFMDIAQELLNNENDLFAEAGLLYFRIFREKAERLMQNVTMLGDNVLQLREAYQSTLDVNLNNTMKVLTVISSIFMPLTLITGWFGMNFVNMPMLKWQYGIPAVLALSAAVVVFMIVYMKKKKWW